MKNSSVSVTIMFGFDDITGRGTKDHSVREKTGVFPKLVISFMPVQYLIYVIFKVQP